MTPPNLSPQALSTPDITVCLHIIIGKHSGILYQIRYCTWFNKAELQETPDGQEMVYHKGIVKNALAFSHMLLKFGWLSRDEHIIFKDMFDTGVFQLDYMHPDQQRWATYLDIDSLESVFIQAYEDPQTSQILHFLV